MSAACCAEAPPHQSGRGRYVEKSVYRDCVEEADRHKWIESERAGYDLGEVAIRHWVKEHWTVYLRARWVQHLQGTCFWIELDRGDFGLLEREFCDQPELLGLILGELKAGKENLDVLRWAGDHHLPIDQVIDILTALDVNSRRLAHRFEAA
ncbi:MAG: hypothetical protein K2X82_23825 [Gemmataceae bacterium]|nr:hypothetical protein [Gemmataceae bacterium]